VGKRQSQPPDGGQVTMLAPNGVVAVWPVEYALRAEA
jgi:hypothetical protein